MSLIGASSSDVRGAQIRAQRAHAQETEQRHEALRKAALANPRARPAERRRRDDSVTSGRNRKTRICKFWAEGSCRRAAEDCWFAHGADDLKVWDEYDDSRFQVEAGDDVDPTIPDEVLHPTSGGVVGDLLALQQGVDVGGGWLRYWDDVEGANYYFHEESGETRWEHPRDDECAGGEVAGEVEDEGEGGVERGAAEEGSGSRSPGASGGENVQVLCVDGVWYKRRKVA